MELHGPSYQRHVDTKETTLTPPVIKSLPADQIDFHFACKIPSDMKPHVNGMVAYLLKIVNDYIENAHHGKVLGNKHTVLNLVADCHPGSERTPSTKSSQSLSIQDASEDTPQQGLTLGDPAGTKIYCCTFCNGTFESASSWKRHEQDFHEPQRQWRCPEPGCDQTYWQKKQFVRHHEKRARMHKMHSQCNRSGRRPP
jgi:hypothetical protein